MDDLFERLDFQFRAVPARELRDAQRARSFERMDALDDPGSSLCEVRQHACLADVHEWMAHPTLTREGSDEAPVLPLVYVRSHGVPLRIADTSAWAAYTWSRWPSGDRTAWRALEELEASLSTDPLVGHAAWALRQEWPWVRAWGVLGLVAAGDLDGLRAPCSDPEPFVRLLAARGQLTLGGWDEALAQLVGAELGPGVMGRAAARLLGHARDATFIDALVEQATWADAVEDRWAAIAGLTAPAATPWLLSFLDVRELASEARHRLAHMPADALAPYVPVLRRRLADGDLSVAHLLGRSGEAAVPAIPDLVGLWRSASIEDRLGLGLGRLDDQGRAAAFALASLGDAGQSALAAMADEDDALRFVVVAEAFASVRGAPEAMAERFLALVARLPPGVPANELGYVVVAVAATGGEEGLHRAARRWCEAMQAGLPPSDHHTTPPWLQLLGAELARALPPLLIAETDPARAWLWTRTLGSLGAHLTEEGRQALLHESLHIDRERAAGARQVLDALR